MFVLSAFFLGFAQMRPGGSRSAFPMLVAPNTRPRVALRASRHYRQETVISFYLITSDQLDQVRDNRWLRRMVDVLADEKTPDTIDWDEVPATALTVDESWYDVPALFSDDAMFGELGDLVIRDFVTIKHPRRLAMFIPPEKVLKSLVTFRQTAQLIGALKLRKISIRELEYTVGKKTQSVSGEIISQKSLRRVRLLIEARVLTKLEEPSSYLNDDRDPFTEASAMDALAGFYQFMELMTAAMYDADVRRIEGRGLVMVSI